MDAYDFDGTLYDGDATFDFARHCMGRHPRALLTLPATAVAALRFMTPLHRDKTRFKAALYRFMGAVPDPAREVELFWDSHRSRIGGPCDPHRGDLVISASPEFLLALPCAELGLGLIASPVDGEIGRVLGPNCSGSEKVRRFREAFPEAELERFYSDSRADDPMAAIAREAFLVRGGRIEPWPAMGSA